MTIKIFTLALFIAWMVYWRFQQRKTYKAKPLTVNKEKFSNILTKAVIGIVFLLVAIQLLGAPILQMSKNIQLFQYTGILLVLLGMAISVSARVVLSTNWSNAYEYQIKKDQELITTGIYSLIRHPIYSGMTISFIGAEM